MTQCNCWWWTVSQVWQSFSQSLGYFSFDHCFCSFAQLFNTQLQLWNFIKRDADTHEVAKISDNWRPADKKVIFPSTVKITCRAVFTIENKHESNLVSYSQISFQKRYIFRWFGFVQNAFCWNILRELNPKKTSLSRMRACNAVFLQLIFNYGDRLVHSFLITQQLTQLRCCAIFFDIFENFTSVNTSCMVELKKSDKNVFYLRFTGSLS